MLIEVGDCVEVMAAMPAASVDAIVTDPPYSIEFMGRAWDRHDDEDAAFGYYLAGLIDGEGSFRIGHREKRCEFTMKLRADDVWVLRQAQAFIGHGRIVSEPARAGSAPQAKLVVDTKDGVAALCALLMRYPLRAKKLRDFLTWAEAVDEWLTMERGNRWHGPADRARLAELSGRLRSGRAFSEVAWSGNGFQDWCRQWATEALRVLKPGGHLLAFGGTRTYHRLTAGIEDAGFEIRDTIAWLYGQGFPKSLDVSKAIDKAAGAEREVIGEKLSPDGVPYAALHGERSGRRAGYMGEECAVSRSSELLTAPATPDAVRWQGWGTALKPGHEPVVVARKPLAGTVARNVQAHGTGALNIDGCRIGAGDGGSRDGEASAERRYTTDGSTNFAPTPGPRGGAAAGRWPANVVLSHIEGCVQAGIRRVKASTANQGVEHGTGNGTTFLPVKPSGAHYGDADGLETMEAWDCDPGCPVRLLDEQSRSASRFFYCAKASMAERNAGLGGEDSLFRPVDKGRNQHPTVKPIALMRWLCRLVTPPGGLVLDPFAGSGTTGCAAALEGFQFVGIERDPEYAAVARARLAHWSLTEEQAA